MSPYPNAKVGFTGTQVGCSLKQCLFLLQWFRENSPMEFHHGDCIGADSDAHVLAKHVGLVTIAHPPINETKRAFCDADVCLKAYDYLVRNKHIVDTTRELLACPKGPEELRSGTWSTIRYARKKGKKVTIVYPDGNVEC